MAEAAQPSGESQGAEVTIQIQQPTERALRTPVRRGPRSVLRVSQLLLRAIAGHQRLTLAALKKELGNAGYEVRRKISRHVGESTRSEKGTLLRVSGSDAAGYFRVWRAPKPRRKGGRSRLTLGRRSSRRTLPRSPRPRRPRSRRKAAKKAREVWRRKAKVSKAKPRGTRSTARSRVRSRTKSRARSRARSVAKSRATDQVCARAKEQACARAREQARARSRAQDCAKAKEEECAKAREQACTGAREEARVRAMDNSKVRPSGEDAKPQPKDERRPSSKSRDEKRQDPEKLVKRTIQKPAVAKTDSASSSGHGKARTKSSTKSEGPGCSGNS